ncbi:MAG: tRNA (adenosine(37)-N6)-threonylcarbamoyltransferase complex transferase subunit TsaD [Actinomycetia bacterium]|nr:tRNA (adenosine(37)-N6)-threonylcarbamoyltransferase complex transferase subunit TsaD [Actinomycetes bacterium]
MARQRGIYVDHVILGLETSCDETAVAVVADGSRVLGEAVASSASLQARYGGVVPEVAAREHVAALPALVDAALADAGLSGRDVDAVAVTVGPGLLGSLLVGMAAAKALAVAWRRPLVAVNHLEAHLAANALVGPLVLPALALLVSGGHTGLWLWRADGEWERLGQTRDDAAGEALDKGARLLGLGYPGGPAVEALARTVDGPGGRRLPVARLSGSELDFSFSGLKTALAQGLAQQPEEPARWAWALEEAVVQALVERVAAAHARYPVDRLYVAGGVAANRRLRERLAEWADGAGVTVVVPPPRWCTDNGAMVAAAAALRWNRTGRLPAAPLSVAPDTLLELGRPAGPA